MSSITAEQKASLKGFILSFKSISLNITNALNLIQVTFMELTGFKVGGQYALIYHMHNFSKKFTAIKNITRLIS